MTVGGNLRCVNAEEVLLLLKSSDAVAHDLCYAYAQCADGDAEDAPRTPPQLVLKKWCARHAARTHAARHALTSCSFSPTHAGST
jgi:hypothetical protein